MATTFKLNPDRVAYFEAAGWRAYYDHKWIKMLRLIVGLARSSFAYPFQCHFSQVTTQHVHQRPGCLLIMTSKRFFDIFKSSIRSRDAIQA